jgi:hypothetical protein
MATNILAHINASTQGNLSPPSVIPKHFVRMAKKYTHSDLVLGEAASSRAKGVYIDIHDFCEGAQPTKPTAKARRVYASFPKLYCALSRLKTRNSALHLQEIPN